MSKEEFVKLVEVDQPDAPDYFVYDAIKNRQERPNLAETMSETVKPLAVDDVLRLQSEGAQVVDVRDAIDFEGSHLKGSIGIALQGKYATWCGTLLSHDDPIVVIAEIGDEEEAVMRLGRIGFDNVAGYLQDGMRALDSRPDLVQVTPRMTAAALGELVTTDEAPLVLDVRTPQERNNVGFIENSLNIPLNQLEKRMGEIPEARPIVVHCAGGYRSAIACSLLQRHDIDCTDMVGGFKAWITSKLPVAETADA
jgi:rhodanese-related sulfurtransferase